MNETMYAAKPLSVVVFTGRFGMGHCAAAEAVRQEILAGEPSARVQVVDVMDYLFPEASRRIYEAFGFLVKRCSWVYNLLNRAAGAKMNAPLQGTVVKKLDAILEMCIRDRSTMALPRSWAGNISRKAVKKPLSPTPMAPGRGSALTDRLTTACTAATAGRLQPASPRAR